MEVRSRSDVAEDMAAIDRPDTRGTHTWWLLTAETVGSTSLVVNRGELPAGCAHQLHRHLHAEQAIVITAGRGLHLRDGGAPISVSKGDAIFVPAGEWHGLANSSDDLLEITAIYGGAANREDAGYEVHPGPPFTFPERPAQWT